MTVQCKFRVTSVSRALVGDVVQAIIVAQPVTVPDLPDPGQSGSLVLRMTEDEGKEFDVGQMFDVAVSPAG